MKEQITKRIERTKVIAIADGIYGETCIKLARALCNGGVELLELTLDENNHSHVWETAQLLHCELGDTMTIGFGNVTSVDDVNAAKETGANFVSSFTTDEEIIHAANKLDLVAIPGALTPTEIKFAHRCGADFIKVFPTGCMGPAYFNHIQPAIKGIPILAQSGITRSNVRLYKNAGVTGIFVNDCLYTREMIERENWQEITDTSKTFIHTL